MTAKPLFICWLNFPNRPTLYHLILENQTRTLCGATPKGIIGDETIVCKKSELCKNCVTIYDQKLYGSCINEFVADYLSNMLDSSKFGISIYSLPSIPVKE